MKAKTASKIALIHTLTIAALRDALFENSDEVTISKKYFTETIVPKVSEETQNTIPLCLDLIKSGMPTTLAMMLARSKKLGSVLSGAEVIRTSEHTDCENCDKAEGCSIKDLMMKINSIKTDDTLSPSEALKKAQELLKNPVRNMSDNTPKPSQN